MFSYMDSTALQISLNPYILNVMRELNDDDDNLNAFTYDPLTASHIKKYLTLYNIKQKYIFRICLYNRHGDFTCVGSYPVDNNRVQALLNPYIDEKLVSAFSANTKKVINYSFEDDVFPPERLYDKNKLFSIVREIKDSYGRYGYIEVQQTEKALSFITEWPDNLVNLLISPDGNEILGQPVPSYFKLSLSEYIDYYEKALQGQPDTIFIKETNGIIAMRKDLQSNTYIICAQDNSSVYRHLKITIFLLFVLSLIFLLFLIIVEVQIIKSSTRPLKNLANEMNHITIEKTTLLQTDEVNNDVLKQLNASFKRMVECIQKSAQDSIDAKASEYRSIIKALQSQMDPHFIHNVLTVISATSQEGNMEKVSLMCQQLSEMLRYSSQYSRPNVTISDEIKYTENYLQLMQCRYEERFNFRITTNGNGDSIVIPKLTIQPLVENCFKYAFKSKPAPWFIEISVNISDNSWAVEIDDNGSGFSKEALEKFLEFKESAKHSKPQNQLEQLEINGLSIRNTFLRMWYIYGDNMNFDICVNDYGGAKIKIGGRQNV